MTYHALPELAPPQALATSGLKGALRRQRYQIGLALLAGAILPFVIRMLLDGSQDWPQYTSTSALTAVAITASHMLIRQFGRYPGETPLSSAMSGAAFGFGGAVAWILFSHMSYSRGFLLWGFFVTVAWYSLVGALSSKLAPPRFLFVGAMGREDFSFLRKAEVIPLNAPVPVESVPEVNGLIADLSAEASPELTDFIVACATSGIPVYDASRARELLTGQVELAGLAQVGFEALLPHRNYLQLKTALDVLGAVLALPVVLPVIALAAVAIRLESRGPALFVQERVGYRGRRFRCFKLRSMVASAAELGPRFTCEDDPRITRIGRLIRKYRIDELPQVFNILRGEMSWIGPRPEAAELAAAYERKIPFYPFRHAVKPGISGWAAVNQGNVGDVDAATVKLRYDFFYIKHHSLCLDALILCKTVWIILTGFGAK